MPESSGAALHCAGLKIRYGGIEAVKGVTFSVQPGELVSLIGANGAGKTTTLKAIAGLIPVAEGSVFFHGEEITKTPAYRRPAEGLVIEAQLALFPRLKERYKQLAGTLSGGEQQMLAVARALMARPRVLVLDEPSMGLSPVMVEKIFSVIRDVSQSGVTILLIEQNARLALEAADRGYVMESGLITSSARAQDLLADPAVRIAYLGESP
jgi:branched-chain amino acid transport system ATP-binding protein